MCRCMSTSLSVLICVNCGCLGNLTGRTSVLNASLNGVAVPSASVATTNRVALLGDIRVNQRPLVRQLAANDHVQTDQIVRISIEQTVDGKHYDYDVLMGPWPGRDTWAEGELHNSAPTLFLRRGWGFFWGKMPVAETTWVVAGGIGTIMAVEVVDDGHQRVYFPVGNVTHSSVTVDCVSGSGSVKLETPGRFVEITSGCTISSEQKIEDDAGALEFMSRVTPIAETAWTP